jgi:hypothetical protein
VLARDHSSGHRLEQSALAQPVVAIHADQIHTRGIDPADVPFAGARGTEAPSAVGRRKHSALKRRRSAEARSPTQSAAAAATARETTASQHSTNAEHSAATQRPPRPDVPPRPVPPRPCAPRPPRPAMPGAPPNGSASSMSVRLPMHATNITISEPMMKGVRLRTLALATSESR